MSARRRMSILRVLLVVLSCLTLRPAMAADTPQPWTLSVSMRAVFQALTRTLPWSLDIQQFQAPENRPQIQAALQVLADHTAELAVHGQKMPQSFDFLRRTLALNAQDAVQRYEQGEYRSAQFLLQHLTDNCFACHSRLAQPQDFDLGKQVLAELQSERLPLRERVRLAVATRQFDTALATCEELFRATPVPATEAALSGLFEDYLKIVMRVRGDFSRASAILEQFVQRPDVPAALRPRLVSWVAALKELEPEGLTGEPLPRARALIEVGQRRNRFPTEEHGLIHFVVASSLLHRFVDSQPGTNEQLAEAYYLLGVAEAAFARTSWLAEAPFFLGTAIRLSPTSPIAARAYDALNAYILEEYTGAAGDRPFPDAQEYLDELQRLRKGP